MNVSLIGISYAQRGQYFRFPALHSLRFTLFLVVEALQVQSTMDHHVGPVMGRRFILLGRLGDDDRRAQNEVA